MTTDATPIRAFTSDGIRAARDFLALLRNDPTHDPTVPQELLLDPRYTTEISSGAAPTIRPRPFVTRRDAADYLAPRIEPLRHLLADHAGFWSWLGMYYFESTVRRNDTGEVVLSPLDETFVFHRGETQSFQRRYRHYLWSAWRLQRAHPSAAFLLDQPLHAFGDIADRVFAYGRIFNSVGVVDLILRLYTQGRRQKSGFGRSRGGLRHLIRTLDQLERTHDIYGMDAERLLDILPPDFDRWKPQAALTAGVRS